MLETMLAAKAKAEFDKGNLGLARGHVRDPRRRISWEAEQVLLQLHDRLGAAVEGGLGEQVVADVAVRLERGEDAVEVVEQRGFLGGRRRILKIEQAPADPVALGPDALGGGQ